MSEADQIVSGEMSFVVTRDVAIAIREEYGIPATSVYLRAIVSAEPKQITEDEIEWRPWGERAWIGEGSEITVPEEFRRDRENALRCEDPDLGAARVRVFKRFCSVLDPLSHNSAAIFGKMGSF